ncbi:MAG TPA: hypothetical protein VK978_01450 [Candidatus Saccharimonadales bacterium]|nr:hypothetical protein [Candidatus Saccharimonadales bacterium]
MLFILGIAGLFFLYPPGILLLFMASSSYREAGDAKMARTSRLMAWISLWLIVIPLTLLIIFLAVGSGIRG